MKKTDDPCLMCENYSIEAVCELRDKCPVEAIKREIKRVKKEVDKLESEASWSWEARNSSPGRDFW